MNHFQKDLQFSHSVDQFPFWEKVYRKAFPNFQEMVNHRQNGDHQKLGIDRSIILANSKQILIDEKSRRQDYGDIALESWSDWEKKVPGWARKQLFCDYIAYAIIPTQICYLLPVIELQRVFLHFEEKWKSQYGTRLAQNNGYFTEIIPVPTQELCNQICRCYQICWR